MRGPSAALAEPSVVIGITPAWITCDIGTRRANEYRSELCVLCGIRTQRATCNDYRSGLCIRILPVQVIHAGVRVNLGTRLVHPHPSSPSSLPFPPSPSPFLTASPPLRPSPQHLRSGKHRRYADNDANFANLDALIAQGTSFADFIAAVRGKTKTSQR